MSKNPIFFTISNFGGGGSDKSREISYLNLTAGVPTLCNYFYLSGLAEIKFDQKYIGQISKYDSFKDFLSFVQKSMIDVDKRYSNYYRPTVGNDDRLLLLDSGAANIFNRLMKDVSFTNNPKLLMKRVIDEMVSYYDFAARYKFDYVIGFDIGGKYTFKGDERQDTKLIAENENLKNSSLEVNELLLVKTIEYMLVHQDYKPKIYATVHGETPEEYKKCIRRILELEEQYGYCFDGFALGGVASAKKKNIEQWGLTDDVIKNVKKQYPNFKASNEFKNAVVATHALKIVKTAVGDRPIHALGAGGKFNIVPLSLAGATSFDCMTPARRAYDGSGESVQFVFDQDYDGDEALSKYLIGKIDADFSVINGDFDFEYMKINEVPNELHLCGCPACSIIRTIKDVKILYSNKGNNGEDYYLSRQLMDVHGIWQHVRLSEIMQECNTIADVEHKLTSEFPLMDEWKILMTLVYPNFT